MMIDYRTNERTNELNNRVSAVVSCANEIVRRNGWLRRLFRRGKRRKMHDAQWELVQRRGWPEVAACQSCGASGDKDKRRKLAEFVNFVARTLVALAYRPAHTNTSSRSRAHFRRVARTPWRARSHSHSRGSTMRSAMYTRAL